jgi:hypothetical protein
MEQQATVSPIITTGDTSNEKTKEPVAELIEVFPLQLKEPVAELTGVLPLPTNEPLAELIEVFPLRSFWLNYWLWQHRIHENVARTYCKEVHYKIGEKEFAAIGFPNQAGGWLIRNRYHRLHIGPIGPTHLAHGSNHLAVFTDFIDLLTLVSLLGMANPQLPDLLLLHPTDGMTQLRDIEAIYSKIHLFPWNDGKGNRLAEAALRNRRPSIDQRRLYASYKNLNDWAVHFGKRKPTPFPG